MRWRGTRLRDSVCSGRSAAPGPDVPSGVPNIPRQNGPAFTRDQESQLGLVDLHRIEPLVRFATILKRCLKGILVRFQWTLGTSLIEGINNRIKVIKRMAY